MALITITMQARWEGTTPILMASGPNVTVSEIRCSIGPDTTIDGNQYHVLTDAEHPTNPRAIAVPMEHLIWMEPGYDSPKVRNLPGCRTVRLVNGQWIDN